MHITFFFRKSSPVYHSIENLFDTIISNITDYEITKHISPLAGKGLINRIKIGLNARRNQSDINHITGDIHFIALFLKKNKTILTIHDIGIIKQGNIIKRLIIKWIWFSLPLRKVKYVTVISEFTKNELIKNFKLKPEKVIVINNCISDIYQFHPKQEMGEKPVILQIGTKPNKNLERLINAIQSIDCKLIIVGKLGAEQTTRLKEKNIDYEHHINLSTTQLFEFYKKCDLLTFVSTYEGFGMPIIEANAVGRPVLSSTLEPMKTVAADAALLVNPYNEEEIRKGILRLINDKKLREQLIINGLENAKKYRASIIAKQYESIYNKI